MATQYAASTSVSSGKSRDEIERTLAKYGATSFAYGWQLAEARIMFEMADRQMLFVLPLPDRSAREFWFTPATRTRRSDAAAENAYEQACRCRWRALALVIKAKLEAVASGITTVENEFLAHIVIPGTGGQTVGEYTLPRIAEVYATGRLPALLPGGDRNAIS
jgi:hypothetical protein